MAKCRYCDDDGVYHITLIESGRPETYHVCEAHAQESEPKADGVTLPPTCPKCGARMGSGNRTGDHPPELPAKFFFCECGYEVEQPRPGKSR